MAPPLEKGTKDIPVPVPGKDVGVEEIVANHLFDANKSHSPKVLPVVGQEAEEILENQSTDIKSDFHTNISTIMSNDNRDASEIIENCQTDIKSQSLMDLPVSKPRDDTDGKVVTGDHLPDQDEENMVDEDVELPSIVTDRKQIFMPLDIKCDDPRIYGKWMWFTNGDLYLQDEMWCRLSVLILNRLVILQESSTAKSCYNRGRCQGVIKCYTSGDIATIKQAGIAIQNIINDNVILTYKTNKASKDSLNRSNGDRFIAQYMMTACGGFYEKDELDRWTKVKDDVYGRTAPVSCVEADIDGKISTTGKCIDDKTCIYDSGDDSHAVIPSLKSLDGIYLTPHRRRLDSATLPSQENMKKRYFYPIHGNTEEHDGLWSLFCDITDFDYNGMCELDRLWIESKKLCDEGVFSFTSCETSAFRANPGDNHLKRCMSCVVKNYDDISILIQSGDKLREATNYNIPMYLKVCSLDNRGKKMYTVKYLYTDDRELYEHINDQWQLKNN